MVENGNMPAGSNSFRAPQGPADFGPHRQVPTPLGMDVFPEGPNCGALRLKNRTIP